uniref:Uncharacterized protein n=1 Tax=Minutocellus polymorphus TaxID=265543 RepID=A0A7S0AQD5_9STRA
MADANIDANNEQQREAAASSTAGSTPRAAAGGASGPVPKRGRRGGRAPSNPAAAHGSGSSVGCSLRGLPCRCSQCRSMGSAEAPPHIHCAEGVEMRSNALRDNSNIDPIFSVWEFNVGTVVSSIASTNEVLVALGNTRR